VKLPPFATKISSRARRLTCTAKEVNTGSVHFGRRPSPQSDLSHPPQPTPTNRSSATLAANRFPAMGYIISFLSTRPLYIVPTRSFQPKFGLT
jgi:hypothetical protein